MEANSAFDHWVARMTPAQLINAIMLSLALWCVMVTVTMCGFHLGFWEALCADGFGMGAVCVPLLWLGEE